MRACQYAYTRRGLCSLCVRPSRNRRRSFQSAFRPDIDLQNKITIRSTFPKRQYLCTQYIVGTQNKASIVTVCLRKSNINERDINVNVAMIIIILYNGMHMLCVLYIIVIIIGSSKYYEF